MITKIKHLKEKMIRESIEGDLVIKNVRYKGNENVFSSDVDVSELRFKAIYKINEHHAVDGVALEFAGIKDMEADTADGTQLLEPTIEYTRGETVENKVGYHLGDIYLDTMTQSATITVVIF